MKKVLSLATCLLALALVPVMGSAKDAWYNGIYIGAGTGATRIEGDLIELGLMPSTGESIEGSEYKKTSITGKFFAGYRIMKYLAVEVGYTKIWDTEQSACFTDATGACANNRGDPLSSLRSSAWTVELPLQGWTGFAVGLYPINDTFEAFVKIGAIAWEADVAAYERIPGGFVPIDPPVVPGATPSISSTVDDVGLALGFGMNFNHESGFGIRTEFEWYDISSSDYVDQRGNQLAPKYELDASYQFTLSGVYNF